MLSGKVSIFVQAKSLTSLVWSGTNERCHLTILEVHLLGGGCVWVIFLRNKVQFLDPHLSLYHCNGLTKGLSTPLWITKDTGIETADGWAVFRTTREWQLLVHRQARWSTDSLLGTQPSALL